MPDHGHPRPASPDRSPSNPMSRRTFTANAAAAAVGATALGSLAETAEAKHHGKLFNISLAEWSLHRTFKRNDPAAKDNLKFPVVAKELGIDAIEYVNQFFKNKANDEKYLGELKKICADQGVKSLLIMVDGEGNLGEKDEKKRKQAVTNHHKWVHAAKFLGCHSIRVNARSNAKGYDEQMKLAAEGLRQLTEYGDKHGINVIVENHGGLSSNGKWLAGVMKLVDHPRVGTLPDFGNFRIKGNEWYDRYQGVKELMPYAKAVSAKSHAFDENGNEKNTDFDKMMKIVLDNAPKDWTANGKYVGVEWEGGKPGEREGIVLTRKLLEKVRAKHSK